MCNDRIKHFVFCTGRVVFWLVSSLTALSLVAHGDDLKSFGYVPSSTVRVHARKSAATRSRLCSTAPAKSLPSSWDSRAMGWITPVRNQNPWGTCWTFSALATVETQLVKTGRATTNDCDLSERNMASLHGFAGAGLNDGGNNDMAAAYLLRWEGAVSEAASPYSEPAEPKNPSVHVQKLVWIPVRNDVDDNDALKNAIMEYGAVSTCFRYSSLFEGKDGAYYCTNTQSVNHAVTVVGWDDDYPVIKFLEGKRPSSKGAWLVKNSWGKGEGDGGYLHISYCDRTFMAYPGAVFVPADPDEDYTACYGYDRLGAYLWYCDDGLHSWAAVFRSAWNEELAAVGMYVDDPPFDYVISVYTNVTLGGESPMQGGALAATKIGTVSHWGYATIHLDAPVALADHTAFSVVVENTNKDEPIMLMCCHGDDGGNYTTFTPVARRTYAKCDGIWVDTSDTDEIIDDETGKTFRGNVCLKAYTRSTAAAPSDDTPGGGDSGGNMMMWLHNEYDTDLSYATSWTFGAYANLVGANGRTLFASWLAGFDPADPEDSDLQITGFSISNGVPQISWSPRLGTNRTYTVYGAEDLSCEWREVDLSLSTPCRFFKIIVSR